MFNIEYYKRQSVLSDTRWIELRGRILLHRPYRTHFAVISSVDFYFFINYFKKKLLFNILIFLILISIGFIFYYWTLFGIIGYMPIKKNIEFLVSRRTFLSKSNTLKGRPILGQFRIILCLSPSPYRWHLMICIVQKELFYKEIKLLRNPVYSDDMWQILSEVASVVMSARANYTSFFMQYRLDASLNKCV